MANGKIRVRLRAFDVELIDKQGKEIDMDAIARQSQKEEHRSMKAIYGEISHNEEVYQEQVDTSDEEVAEDIVN